jgi:hypothetical protein
MGKTNACLLFLFLMCSLAAMAQDVIIKKNGDEINSKVLEVGVTEIKYKKADNLNGPDYVIYKSDVFLIKYADGRKDIINPMEATEDAARPKKVSNPNNAFSEKKSFLSAGYGFGVGKWMFGWWGDNGYNYSYYNDTASTLLGPFYVKYEYGISDEWSLGFAFAYLKYETDYQYPYYMYNSNYTSGYYVYYKHKETYESFSGLIRANWHFATTEKLDAYYGFGLGLRTGNWRSSTNDPNQGYNYYGNSNDYTGSPLGFETTIGLRYKFAKHLAAYSEAGIAKSAIQFGLTAIF